MVATVNPRSSYNRDGKTGKAQIVHGLLCAADGRPVAMFNDRQDC